MSCALGIDPGQSGGFAIVGDGPARAWKIPDTERDVWELIRSVVGEHAPGLVVIEDVHSTPQMGVASAFTFGRCLGALRMALVAREIPFESVSPARWQRMFSLPTKRACGDSITAKKNAHKARAQELYPQVRVIHDVADALLIATYGLRLLAQRQPSESAAAPSPDSQFQPLAST